MNNEEKILAMLDKQAALLEALTDKVDCIDSRLEKVEATQAEQGKQLAELTDKANSLEKKVDCLEEKIDRDVVPYVKLLDDDFSSIGRRVTALERAK